MARIIFESEDLARVRLIATLGQTAEAVFGLDTFERTSNTLFAGWRRQVRLGLGAQNTTVRALIRDLRPIPAMLWLLNGPQAADHRQLQAAGLSVGEVVRAVNAFRQVAVAPYWGRVRYQLELERHAKSGLMATGGVEHLLSTLSPRGSWDSRVLELPSDDPRTVELRGRGLLVVPSLFLTRRSAVVIAGEPAGAGPPVLVFSAPPTLKLSAKLWNDGASANEALPTLVGRTRAEILRAVTDGGTTGELARRLGISSAVVSQHTGVLRKSGLIRSSRNRNSVLHTLTPLGMALLGGDDPSQPAARIS
ncbi:winged helix-turn-helix domain-containing protein [Amycolatopsis sp. NPDC004079]|uniref:ArsR/SmtB family transcription factor n=1 Tax=Amycolatopsis sp. NPDC004079 TaxID=3154549 RepID=UPI0033A2F639